MVPVATETQLISVFKAPNSPNGIITAYTVYCNTSAMQAYPEQMIGPNAPIIRSRAVFNQIAMLGDMKTVWTILGVGLKPYTRYDCYVTANTSAGEGPPSSIQSSRTSPSGKLWLLYKLYKLSCVNINLYKIFPLIGMMQHAYILWRYYILIWMFHSRQEPSN